MMNLDLIKLLTPQSLTHTNISSNKPACAEAIQTHGLLLQGLKCLLSLQTLCAQNIQSTFKN